MSCEYCCDDDVPQIIESIDKYFQPATNNYQYNKDRGALVSSGLSQIEELIAGQPGDPGKLFPLHEHVRRVIGSLQTDVILAKGSRQ
jgi:hypothetical protein